MGRIVKFEKINMKIVAAIAVAIILILTAIFVAINTGIFNSKKKDNSNTNTNTNLVDGPIVSEEAKDRTKPVDELNSAEKKYIIEQNFLEYLKNLNPEKYQELVEQCIEDQACVIDIEDFLDYIEDPENDPENPDDDNVLTIKDCSGNISYIYQNGEFIVDMSGVTCKGPNTDVGDSNSNSDDNSNSNIDIDYSNSNSNFQAGIGDAPEELKNRTKPSNQLTEEEKNYIVAENLYYSIMKASAETISSLKRTCVDSNRCLFDVSGYSRYSNDEKLGFNITGCSGNLNVIYVPGFVTASKSTSGALKIIKNEETPKANEIRLEDAFPHLNSNLVSLGSYVKKEKTNVYVSATQEVAGALKVVNDNVEPKANEIRLSSISGRVYAPPVEVGNYIVLKNDYYYIITTSSTKNAKKVVSDTAKVGTNEIKISAVKNLANYTTVGVNDYVVLKQIDAYVSTTKGTSGALRIVADFTTPVSGQIRVSEARPYLDTTKLKVGDYVTEGVFLANASNVSCKRG